MATPRRTVLCAASTLLLCASPVIASPAFAAAHHKAHTHAKKAHSHAKKAHSHAKKAKPVLRVNTLTLAGAQAAAVNSAAPLVLNGADQVNVTGCTAVPGPGYQCGVELQAAQSGSVCRWTVIVQMTVRGPEAVSYSSAACTN